MRPTIRLTIVFCVCAALLSRAQACDQQRAEFTRLSAPLIFQSESDWKRFDKNQYETATDAAHKYLQNQILEQLRDGKTDARTLESFIRCIQAIAPYQNFRDQTNAPVAFTANRDSGDIVVAYYIYRGGPAIPDTLPYLEAFLNIRSDGWSIAEMIATPFERSTYFVHRLASPAAGQRWFLLSGFEIGDTGTRLRLQIVALEDGAIRTLWSKSGLVHTVLAEAQPDYIVLSRYEGYKNGHDVFRKQRLDVAPGGFREH